MLPGSLSPHLASHSLASPGPVGWAHNTPKAQSLQRRPDTAGSERLGAQRRPPPGLHSGASGKGVSQLRAGTCRGWELSRQEAAGAQIWGCERPELGKLPRWAPVWCEHGDVGEMGGRRSRTLAWGQEPKAAWPRVVAVGK